MEIIIYDTEFTSWEGALQANWSREGEAREIVQFSAVKLGIYNNGIRGIQMLDTLVKPHKNPQLSNYFTELTGISQEDVDVQGILNHQLMEKIKSFSDGGSIPMFSWGNDLPSIRETAEQCHYVIDWVRSYDLRELFHKADYDVRGYNSGNLYKLFNLELEIQEHNAMEDVKSLTSSIEFVYQIVPDLVKAHFSGFTAQ